MDKVIELTHQLKEELDALPLFQEYKRIKSLVDSSDELTELKREIAKISDKKNKDAMLKRYNEHPLVNNLKVLEEEVSNYLRDICEIINKK